VRDYCLFLKVNNSTNINKTKHNLSPKESLNSDVQQLHQYQYNKQYYITKIRFDIIVCFVDIGGIVDHHCLNFL
jgi:hypothetical protein